MPGGRPDLASPPEERPAQRHLRLGPEVHDLTTRALVVGVLDRTPGSFFDRRSYSGFDAWLRRAEQLVDEGADVLDVGGAKAGPEVGEGEELERVAPAVEALHRRFAVPLSVDTWRASVAEAAYAAGAVVGNDTSGFADPRYLAVAAAAGATVVATHARPAPRAPDPEPRCADVVAAVRRFLTERARAAEAAGIAPERIVVDAGLDRGKTRQQSLALLRESASLAALGYPLVLSAANEALLGRLLGPGVAERRAASLAAAALGVARGCRVVRAHDVRGTRRVCDAVAAILEADDPRASAW